LKALEAFRHLLEWKVARARRAEAERALVAADAGRNSTGCFETLAMPTMKRLEMIRQMRSMPQNAKIPALAL